MPTDQEHIQHLLNVLKKTKADKEHQAQTIARTLQREIVALQERIQQIEELYKQWPSLGNTNVDIGNLIDSVGKDAGKRAAPITESIPQYLRETGKTQFTAADLKHYLEGRGFGGKWLYNSIYETLTRMVKSKRLIKTHDGYFEPTCEHKLPREQCEQCRTQTSSTTELNN